MWLVEELETSTDIVELVSKYTKLKKSWVNYKAVCPFPGHNEKTPSFVVSPVKQLAYCFGCHKWWWALKFIMDIENMEFKEAIQVLANIVWKSIEWFDAEKHKIKKNIYSLYGDTVLYYKKALEKSPEAQKYLFERWLKKEDFKKFSFGFSDSWLWLYNYLKEKWYDDWLIVKSNIFVNLKDRKDKFIGRIIFPIRNLRWDFVAFTWRILEFGEPKYINSPASDLYDKSEILYGLYDAKKSIVDMWFVIVVEGQMDVIRCQTSWYSNTVAVSGTALTQKHLSVLKRLTQKIYLSFDSDDAWEKATKSSLEIIKNKGFEIKIIDLPKWSDPDSIINSWKDFSSYIKNALSPVWYYLKKSKFSLDSIEDKKLLLTEILDMVSHYSDSIEREFYLKEVSLKLDIKENIVYDKFNKIERSFNRKRDVQEFDNHSKWNFSLEEIAIWYIINDNTNSNYIKENIVFKEDLTKELEDSLCDINIVESLPPEKKDRLKAVAMKISLWEDLDNSWKIKENLDSFLRKLNLYLYKKTSSRLKKEMESWNQEAFLKYNEILSLAKKNNIK